MVEYKGAMLPDGVSVKEIFSALEKRFVPGKSFVGEAHWVPELIYVKEGEYHLRVDDKHFLLRKGQLMIYAPYAFHIGDERTDCESRVLIMSFVADLPNVEQLYNKVIDVSEQAGAILSEVVDKCKDCLERKYFDDRVEMVVRESATEYELIEIKKLMELFFVKLFAGIYFPDISESDELKRVKKFLKNNVSQNFTVEEIAYRNLISVTKLKRMFNEGEMGGVINYHISLKIERAKKLLREERYNVSEIAELCGFNSIHYFSRVFKQRVGASPIEYLKAYFQQ